MEDSIYINLYTNRIVAEVFSEEVDFDNELIDVAIYAAVNSMSAEQWAYFKEETFAWRTAFEDVEEDAAQELTRTIPALIVFMMRVYPVWVEREFMKQLAELGEQNA